MLNTRLGRFFVQLAILVSFILTLSDSASAKSIRIGFVGAQTTEKTIERWTPLVDHLSREVGIPFEMILREDYKGLVDSLNNDEIDLYEGGAFSHVEAMPGGLAELLVGDFYSGKKTYKSVFIVRADSDIHDIAGLKGKKLALTDELSTSGYLIPRVMISRAGIDSPDEFFKQIVLTGSHDRSIEALLEGAVDTAAVGDFFIPLQPPEKRSKIRTLMTSDPIPCGAITIRKDFDTKVREKILQAFLDYEKKLPENLRHFAEVAEGFFIQKESEYDIVRSYAEELRKLPALSRTTPLYHRIPTVFADRITGEKKTALAWIAGSFLLLVAILLFATLKFRRGFSSSIGLTVAATVSVIAAIFSAVQTMSLFSSIDSFASSALGKLENVNLRAMASIEADHTENLGRILSNLAHDEIISWAQIYKDGFVIASTDPSEVGASVIENVKSGAFDLSQKNTFKNFIQIEDPIIANDRKFATLHVGITFQPISAEVGRAMTINFIVMASVLATGIVAAFFSKRRLARPIHAMAEAIERLREGEDSGIGENEYPDVKQVAMSLSRLGRELAEKQKFETLKNYETDHDERDFDPQVTHELEEKIAAMEAENESFRRLRMTEAIGQSPAWLRTLRDAAIRARDRAPALIYGPTGSGKTGIARVIHALSPRSGRPFGEFSCAEFASGDPLIVLGKLFGYGADAGIAGIDRKGQKGILEEFDGGTLFLDEAGVLPLQAQQLLLLPLEGRPFSPAAGKGKPRAVNIRFIFATNEPLEELASSGKMRKDLLRRIFARGIVKIPSLANRDTDILPLASYFLARRNAASEKKLSFSKEATRIISQYDFNKYNVSELLGVVDHAFDSAIFDGSAVIEPKHLAGDIQKAVEKMTLEKYADVRSKEIYDGGERRELVALRSANFNMTLAEKRLGFAKGSKMLTNHFRGIVYAALERANWAKDAAIEELVGPGADKSVSWRVRTKILDYVETAKRNMNSGSTEKIFNNLPGKYHSVAEKFLEAIRKGLITEL